MRRIFLLTILMIPSAVAFADEECPCRPVPYQELLNMSVGDIGIKMRNYARFRDVYLTQGSTYCYYTCVNEYEHLRIVQQDKESEAAKDRAAKRQRAKEVLEQPIGLLRDPAVKAP